MGTSYAEDGFTASIFRIGLLVFEDGFQNNSSSSNSTTFGVAYSEIGFHDVEFSIAESAGELFTISSIDLGEAFNESDIGRK